MNEIVLISGTRKGIGRELSLHFLSKGKLVIGCSRGNSSIEHENYTHYCLDIADEKAVISMIRGIMKNQGRVDVLINNAGIASMNHILLSPISSVKKILTTNIIGTFIMTREVAKLMSKKKYGRIVNMVSIATPLRLKGEAIYAASKAAVVNFTEVASKELAEFNITVNAVGPTPVPTDLVKNVPQKKMSELLELQTIHRFGTFPDILNCIEFFINPKSDFITGQILYLGGVLS